MIAALIAVLLALTAGHVEVVRSVAPVLEVSLSEGTRTYVRGYMLCWPDGHSRIILAHDAPAETKAHELLHAYACMTDGDLSHEYTEYAMDGHIGGPNDIRVTPTRTTMVMR